MGYPAFTEITLNSDLTELTADGEHPEADPPITELRVVVIDVNDHKRRIQHHETCHPDPEFDPAGWKLTFKNEPVDGKPPFEPGCEVYLGGVATAGDELTLWVGLTETASSVGSSGGAVLRVKT